MKTLFTVIGIFLGVSWLLFGGFYFGWTAEKSNIITDSLTTHTDRYTIDLPYRLDTSHEDMLARRVGDTIYVYHKP